MNFTFLPRIGNFIMIETNYFDSSENREKTDFHTGKHILFPISAENVHKSEIA